MEKDIKNNELRQERLTGERALFMAKDLAVYDSVFADGESPLKACENIVLDNCLFHWKYPLWYCRHVRANKCTLFDMARAGIWYTDDIEVTDTMVEAPKNFRRCSGVKLTHVSFPNAEETLWNCSDVEMCHVSVRGDYFALNSRDMKIDHMELAGNYAFDGGRNLEIHNAKILSRDAFWNTDNVTVYDSFISGEYLGWNAKNLTFVDCTIESLQGMCYIDNLIMRNCKLLNTTLAFEYSTVDAEIAGNIDSVMNPTGGTIRADHIGELILQNDKIDPSKTRIICKR